MPNKDQNIQVTYHGQYFWGATQEFWRDSKLSCSAKVVWILLLSSASMPHGVKISVLSRWSKRYYAGVIKDIQQLIAHGYIERAFEKKQGVVITKTIYKLYDTPQNRINTTSPRTAKNGLRGTDSVNRSQVFNKLVDNKLVSSSSISPPLLKTQQSEEEEINLKGSVKEELKTGDDKSPSSLPHPFNKLTTTQIHEANKLCIQNGLILRQQVMALTKIYRGKLIKKPFNLLCKTLRGGGVLDAAALAKSVEVEQEKQAADSTPRGAFGFPQHILDRNKKTLETPRIQENSTELDLKYKMLPAEKQAEIKQEALQRLQKFNPDPEGPAVKAIIRDILKKGVVVKNEDVTTKGM